MALRRVTLSVKEEEVMPAMAAVLARFPSLSLGSYPCLSSQLPVLVLRVCVCDCVCVCTCVCVVYVYLRSLYM